MSWYRDDDGKIITDEEFEDDCFNCSAFCSEGTITVPCNGERTDCPYFKEVDTSEYDKKISNKKIDEFAHRIRSKVMTEIDDCADELDWIDEIAEQMKEK